MVHSVSYPVTAIVIAYKYRERNLNLTITPFYSQGHKWEDIYSLYRALFIWMVVRLRSLSFCCFLAPMEKGLNTSFCPIYYIIIFYKVAESDPSSNKLNYWNTESGNKSFNK